MARVQLTPNITLSHPSPAMGRWTPGAISLVGIGSGGAGAAGAASAVADSMATTVSIAIASGADILQFMPIFVNQKWVLWNLTDQTERQWFICNVVGKHSHSCPIAV